MNPRTQPRVRRIPGCDVVFLSAKEATFRGRGIDSVEALQALVAIAEATNASVTRQLEHDPVRLEISLAGVSVIAVEDRWTGTPLILTAWVPNVRHARAAVQQAATKVAGRTPLADRLGIGKAA